ncbi:hypothetical protein ACTXT7_013502 [Hymenolepis weldensis]
MICFIMKITERISIATLRTSIPGLVGGTQRINLDYQVTDTGVSSHLNDMNLIMKILPQAAWEALGKPPPSEVDFISSVPQTQDIQFSLNYKQKRVALASYRVEFNRTISFDKLSFTCPENIRTNAYFSCSLTTESADGFGGKVTWGKQYNQDFYFPTKDFDYIGTQNVYSGDSLSDCRENGLVITGTQAMYAGDVQEILRATCDSGKVYDYFTDSCQGTSFDGIPCAPNEVFTPVYRVCYSSIQNINKRNIKEDASTTDTTIPYTIVKVLTVDASFPGLQSFKFQKPFRIEVGDRIAIVADKENAIDCTVSTSTSPADFVYNIQTGPALSEGTKISGFTRLRQKRFKARQY